MFRSWIHIGLGDEESGLSLLEQGYEARDSWMRFLRLGFPFSYPLRDEPRFQDLVRRMNVLES